jgi:tetratricopeptide (TPR) repeat protein
MSNDKYQLCPCGSGKKLKFCCYEKGRTPGQIPDAELFRQAAEFRICESHVNPNWQESGLAEVLIVRQTLSLKYVVGVYLVDVFCLGLKNTFVRATFRHADVRTLFSRFSQPMEEVSYEDARSIILGAVEYARQLGFEPHEEWKISGPIVEVERPFRRNFTFGCDGKPLYIQGPDDDAQKIMKKLGLLAEKGEAHFLTIAGEEIDGGNDDDEETSFDERCEDIEQDLRDGLFEDAQSEIETLIDEFPGHWEPPYLKGTCLAMQGDAEQAIPFLEQSLAICPSSEAYYNLAAAHKAVFQIRGFLTCMEKAIELDDANGEIGMKAKAEIDAFTAMTCKTSGITLDQYIEGFRRFEDAFACLNQGRFEEAIRGFNRVLDIQPDHVQSYGNLGLAHACQGDRDAAIRYFDKAIALDTHYQPAIENRQLVLTLRPGETLKAFGMREIDFYADKARALSSSNSNRSPA